jgi:hypothetical protein
MEPTTIAGQFRKWDNVAHAIDLLSTAGFNADQISLILPNEVINLLNQANAADVEGLRREWEREGWTGFGRSA